MVNFQYVLDSYVVRRWSNFRRSLPDFKIVICSQKRSSRPQGRRSDLPPAPQHRNSRVRRTSKKTDPKQIKSRSKSATKIGKKGGRRSPQIAAFSLGFKYKNSVFEKKL